jgi:uncharacterized membrane-anchored protein
MRIIDFRFNNHQENVVIKTVIILMLIAIVGSLFSGLLYMFKDHGNSDRMVKALTLRIGLSITLFLLLLAGFYFGLIPPQKV